MHLSGLRLSLVVLTIKSNLIKLNESIIKLKQSFNVYVMDVYYDTEYLYKTYSVGSYVAYANKKLNLFIKEKL